MSTFSPEQWRELNLYLDEALALPEEQRAAWVRSLGEKDAQLAANLQELLDEQCALQEEHFLEESPVSGFSRSAMAGQIVGAYTLISLIGQGGMGSVWLARRSDGRFERQAAVKFLSIAWSGGACEERFRREGAILARLTHPHIAQLLDAGVSPAGQPYLVLEYVDGEPIDQYCDRHKLDLQARVRLFLDVLQAVAQAHANLIVHRDIKPSNVLVTRVGQVKLLDFGIAKLLEQDGEPGAASLLTREAGSALTPRYAAPEQLKDEPVTTATDVYSLGVLLYLLLTGQHPGGEESRSTAELVRNIVDTEPARMSSVVGGAGLGSDAAKRGSSPEKLRRLLRGDLDTIVFKALKKDPLERYVSVLALADDLNRYLRHEPIWARADTVFYRTGKFLRRNWVPLAAVAMVIMSLATGLVVANHQRVIAEQRFWQLRQLSRRIFDLDKRIRDLPGSTQARQTLVAAALEYLDRLASDAKGDIDLSQELGEGYWRVARIQGVPTELNLGEPDKAEESLKRADAIFDAVLAKRPQSAAALLRSGVIAHDRMILAEGEHRTQDALALAHRSAERLDSFLRLGTATNSQRVELSGNYANIALALINMHRYAEAVTYARRSTELIPPIPSARYRVAQALSLLANALRYQGDLSGALAAIEQARRIAEQASYADQTSRYIDEYGIFLRQGYILGEDGDVNLGRPQDAIEPLQKAFDLSERAAQRDSRDATSRTRLGNSGIALGNILRNRDPQAALKVYDHALERLREIHDSVPAQREQALLLANSSYPLLRLHRDSEAKRRIDEAFAILEQTREYPAPQIKLDSDAYLVSRAAADYQAEQGNPQRALILYQGLLEKVMASDSQPFDDLRDAPSLSSLYQAMAHLYRRTGDRAREQEMEARRLKLWTAWSQKLPTNSFVSNQLQAAKQP